MCKIDLKNYQRLKDKMAKKEFDEEANKLAEKLLQED